ncbi:NUDIX domain-containing protein [Nocardia sp. NPDC050408]|jgi:8-oxo-dGTP diphosphatase|uniref:NUDIX domain-containing protein n=1 Tax=unclassified Nocardia TaxID=2637762 RepID=UPI00343F15E5
MIETTLLEKLTREADRDEVQQLAVGAVVQHSGKVLLLQRPADDFMGGIWELPSGKVDSGESIDQALIREVKEETATGGRNNVTDQGRRTGIATRALRLGD